MSAELVGGVPAAAVLVVAAAVSSAGIHHLVAHFGRVRCCRAHLALEALQAGAAGCVSVCVLCARETRQRQRACICVRILLLYVCPQNCC